MNYYDRSERMWYITKSREDNDLTNRTDVISIEYNIELSIPIGQGEVYDENETGQ